MHRSLGDNVCVQAVAKVDRVDVVTTSSQISMHSVSSPHLGAPCAENSRPSQEGNSPLEITVHDSEEDL